MKIICHKYKLNLAAPNVLDMAEDTTKLMDLDDVEGPDLPGNIDKIPESEAEEADLCRRIVEEIRKEEFGIGIVLSEDGQRLMKVGRTGLIQFNIRKISPCKRDPNFAPRIY